MSEKNDIRELIRSDNHNIAYRKLFKLMNYDLEEIDDKWFVYYMLSSLCRQLKRDEESRVYIIKAKELLSYMENYRVEIGKTNWLYLEIFKDELNREELIEYYKEIMDNFNYLNEDDEIIIGLKSSIYILKSDFNKVIENFKKCLLWHYIDTVKGTIREAKKYNYDLYNELLSLREQYETGVINF